MECPFNYSREKNDSRLRSPSDYKRRRSRIDYCNGLLYGLPDCEIAKLQRVQNAAARLLTSSSKYDHITPVLQEQYTGYLLDIEFILKFYF